MPNRTFVLLAEEFEKVKNKIDINGWFMSEKLDGQRAIWLPHTRGLPVEKIPFANRFKDHRPHIATGLWSRYGKVIHAPDFFLVNFPKHPLDGELYLGRGMFQQVSSAIKKLPENRIDSEWRNVEYRVFDVPTLDEFYREGDIRLDTKNKIKFDGVRCGPPDLLFSSFEKVYYYLQGLLGTNLPNIKVHEQAQLPFHTSKSMDMLEGFYSEVINKGGEGVILRKYNQLWEPKRVKNLLKVKPVSDDEGHVIGFTSGKGRLVGLMGNLVLDWKGKRFEISGFTDKERALLKPFNEMEPGQTLVTQNDAKINFSPFFAIGDKITFKYRELSDDGIPKEARFFRPAEHHE